jgi:serine/threonine protein phosphatase PrpC
MTVSLRYATTSLTHPGMVRSANEDSFVALEDRGVWMVADGMGGHANGQWASTTVVGAVGAAGFAHDFDHDVEALTGAIQQANATIYATSKQQGASMGSTAAALYLNDARFACIWAGDSRIYLLRDGVLHRMTRDHTQVEEMVERGMLTPEQAQGHPMSHVLSRAVGVQDVLDLDAVSDYARPRDIFLLCSDGLSGLVSESEIREQLANLPREAACNRLLEMVLARGAPDNVTMIAVACEEKTTLTLSPASAL